MWETGQADVCKALKLQLTDDKNSTAYVDGGEVSGSNTFV